MAKGFKCDNCGKGIEVGHNVSHAKNRTRRIFRPNLHNAKLKIEGTIKTYRLCTKCLRTIKKGQNFVKSPVTEEKISTIAPVASGLV
ncbi:MAG: 50S ribosomal protein L28 [Candidatus Levybacteria bacterium RIFOXYA1_FULL_41_10]|nr:MAG: 50S ribosomal protein L28 [Candidatus Levybacteria bacterium RIFCSPHIGHO2_01_FULL_40_83]OGH27623.1 MAG: 50S ribosomal protein L28 [Candidatus Levybacteria bacterium RIFCSPHIGHO2_02_FULL_40_29]OGH30257.1 MAG: 50S ribosomal protein L28 [Candidatus Levybacteria bacterium RIFCSPHIGHO2_12_FULL_40_44]OGH41071.1 MAG: 50S ribosomal protein L28 [Candidatus Levybacteria bacterium RIFCSPLOWO2_01_FULL_40_96]OGH49757.1 MAG: 50S ribosomal protein L28 [Candidatus Levybacteria bacterium RIFCSPLOWO2_02_